MIRVVPVDANTSFIRELGDSLRRRLKSRCHSADSYAYTADALRHNDWKCKCQSSAESFFFSTESSSGIPVVDRRLANWLKDFLVCHVQERLSAAPPLGARRRRFTREPRDGTASHLTITILLWPPVADGGRARPTAPTQSRPWLMTGIVIFSKRHHFLPLPFPNRK